MTVAESKSCYKDSGRRRRNKRVESDGHILGAREKLEAVCGMGHVGFVCDAIELTI